MQLVVLRGLKRLEAQIDANSSTMTQTQSRVDDSTEVDIIGDRDDELAGKADDQKTQQDVLKLESRSHHQMERWKGSRAGRRLKGMARIDAV